MITAVLVADCLGDAPEAIDANAGHRLARVGVANRTANWPRRGGQQFELRWVDVAAYQFGIEFGNGDDIDVIVRDARAGDVQPGDTFTADAGQAEATIAISDDFGSRSGWRAEDRLQVRPRAIGERIEVGFHAVGDRMDRRDAELDPGERLALEVKYASFDRHIVAS